MQMMIRNIASPTDINVFSFTVDSQRHFISTGDFIIKIFMDGYFPLGNVIVINVLVAHVSFISNTKTNNSNSN